jgi:hypothetical protein
MAPMTNPGDVVEVAQRFVVLPSLATTFMVSTVEVPVFLRGGVKVIDPLHVPPLAGPQLTVPGKVTGFGRAEAVPDATITTSSDGSESAATMRASFRAISIPRFGLSLPPRKAGAESLPH